MYKPLPERQVNSSLRRQPKSKTNQLTFLVVRKLEDPSEFIKPDNQDKIDNYGKQLYRVWFITKISNNRFYFLGFDRIHHVAFSYSDDEGD